MSGEKIVLFGYNAIGKDVAQHLRQRDQSFVVADHIEPRVKNAVADGIDAKLVNLTDDMTLQSVGLPGSIRVVFCLYEDDSENVFLTISARALDPTLNIVSICRSEDAGAKLLAAGANKVINPYQLSGRKIYEVIRKPEVVELLDHVVFGKQDLHIVEVVIERGSALEHRMLDEVTMLKNYNVVLLGVEDTELSHDVIFSTSGVNHKLDAGDKLVVIGPALEIERFRRELASA